MVYQISRLDGEPILVITVTPPTDAYTQVQQKLAELEMLVQTMGDPVIFRINDYSAVPAPTFNDITFVLAEETRSPRPGSVADPRIRNVVVGSHPMVHLAVEGLKQAQYGEIEVPLFEAYDAALAYVRAALDELRAAE